MISDRTIAHLQTLTEQPDFSGTRYRIVREIGRGGMGIVYDAHDQELDRSVAVKVLATELASSEHARRLLQEARTVARLEHPGIVPVHDVGELPDGRIFYAMKLVRGMRLDDFMRQDHPAAERLRVFLKICDAVAFAHSNGVVHRDLKPSNVIIGEFGAVLVVDWGVAIATDTVDHLAVGTPGYAAPEQERGEKVDATADVYALGALLQKLLGETVPRALRAVFIKAMSSEPQSRYANARELSDEIARYLDDQPLVAYRETIAERISKWLSRNHVLITIIVAYLLMRVIVFLTMRR